MVKTIKTNMKKTIVMGVAVLFVMLSVVGIFKIDDVSGLSRACQSSAACREAAAKEQEANKNAAEAASSANAYQIKVKETAAEIAGKEAEIAESEATVTELQKKIEESEKEIAKDQDALAELLVNMHFEADAEPIKILAGASSISDLAEKAAREEVVRDQINTQAAKIKREKADLEEDKKEVEKNLLTQQKSKKELEAKKKEREELVEKYQNDAEAYEKVAAAAREEKQAAERKWQEEHSSSLSGLAYYSGDDTYPWQEDCPGKQDYYLTIIDGNRVGGYVCECVSYVGWKAYEAYGLYLGWGNAYSWDDVGRSLGYTVDHKPAAGSIGQVDGGAYGHVFWVEGVNSDGSINVTEYNNAYATFLYFGDSHYGDFGARTIPASEVGNYNYIHL